MSKYYIYDREIVMKKGLDKGFLRSVNTYEQALVYVSNNPNAYIIKKVSKWVKIQFTVWK